jgi:sec-independent protein translocase protein TatB
MFDLGWAEMAVIMLVALIVIGPKDLPKVARTIGQWTGKARALARDFQRSLDDMAREAELDEIKKSIDSAGRFNVKRAVKDMVDPEDEFDRAFEIDEKANKPRAVSNVKPKSIAKPPAGERSADAAGQPQNQSSSPPTAGDAAVGKPAAEKVEAGAAADEATSSRG